MLSQDLVRYKNCKFLDPNKLSNYAIARSLIALFKMHALCYCTCMFPDCCLRAMCHAHSFIVIPLCFRKMMELTLCTLVNQRVPLVLPMN